MHIDESVNAGMLPHSTVGEPGTHGAAVAGMHGIGVSTPSAAAVAAATVGLASDMHIPNGRMLTNGLLSMIVAMGTPEANVRLVGSTTSEAGVIPNVHCSMAPLATAIPMTQPPSSRVGGTADTGGG